MNLENRICPICDNKEAVSLWNGYVKCVLCGCIYVKNVKSVSYEDNYYYFDSREKERLDMRAKKLFKILSKYVKNGFLIDYGCASGEFVNFAFKNGFEVVGTDISSYALKNADSNIQDKLLLLDDFKKKFNKKADVITMWDVLEHLDSPIDKLKELKPYLKIGGKIIISTPNVESFWAKFLKKEWHGFNIPQYHITYFNKKNITKIFNSASYKCISVYSINPMSPLFLIKNSAVGLTRVIFRKDKRILYAIVAGIIFIPDKILELIAPFFNFAETLIVVAENN